MTNQYTEKELAILEAALRLFVGKGFHAAPTSKIAKEAGVSNGTLFHYFETKDILIRKLYLWIKETKHREVTLGLDEVDGVKNKVEYLFFGTIDWLIENPEKNLFSNQFEFSPLVEVFTAEELAAYVEVYMKVFKKGIDQGVLSNLCLDWMYVVFRYQILSVTQYVRFRPEFRNDTKYREKAFDMLWKAIAD